MGTSRRQWQPSKSDLSPRKGIAPEIDEWYPTECVSHTPIKLDDLMAGETDCEGCDTWICKECGQDVELEDEEL